MDMTLYQSNYNKRQESNIIMRNLIHPLKKKYINHKFILWKVLCKPNVNMIVNLHANILIRSDQCNYFHPYLVQTPCT